jgi:CTLH/CRA C-terminal to LisH motif domain
MVREQAMHMTAQISKARHNLPQEFVELVRQQDGTGAISYAREYLSQWAEPFEAEMQRAFAVLVFTADTQCSRYQVAASTLNLVMNIAP